MTLEEVMVIADRILKRCKGPKGAFASAVDRTNYGAYFTRDTLLNSYGLMQCGDDILTEELDLQIKELIKLQGNEGQIPSNFTDDNKISFGSLTPKLDGPPWFIIGLCELIRLGRISKTACLESVENAVACLDALDYNDSGLIHCPMGSDWADEYICQGYVLHVQTLRAWALRLAALTFKNEKYNTKSKSIVEQIESNFLEEKGKNAFLISHYSRFERSNKFDFASNILFTLNFPESKISARILDYISDEFLAKGLMPQAFAPIIDKQDPQWNTLHSFHLFEFKNNPGHYHNGGIWWIWLGWYCLSLKVNVRVNDMQILKDLVQKYFEGIDDFNFSEYITPKAEEGGQTHMAFSAAGIKMLYQILLEKQ